MAREKPRDHRQMSSLSGVGKAKLEAYADIFLEVISGYGG
jgi:hypothetical protein